ncbi:cytochrome b [Devosia sp.]|uniref:cytochrome b n=1 Tax=Devosia sp. TaxID=1871048 RepID=UPI003263066C
MTIASADASIPSKTSPQRFDGITIAFHWITAVLVLALFSSALIWQQAPRDLGWRRPLESLHISLGILLAIAIVGRLLWRLLPGRRLPAANRGIQHLLSQAMHLALYALLVAQVGLGFTLRWFQGEEFSFFGLFSIPALIGTNEGLERTVENLHNLTAWTIIYLVAGHAGAALFHHYWVKDGVLARMMPAWRERA